MQLDNKPNDQRFEKPISSTTPNMLDYMKRFRERDETTSKYAQSAHDTSGYDSD